MRCLNRYLRQTGTSPTSHSEKERERAKGSEQRRRACRKYLHCVPPMDVSSSFEIRFGALGEKSSCRYKEVVIIIIRTRYALDTHNVIYTSRVGGGGDSSLGVKTISCSLRTKAGLLISLSLSIFFFLWIRCVSFYCDLTFLV
jgi:hypothetical protein